LIDHEAVVGLDVETDIAGAAPNETRDALIGVGLAFSDECFYGDAKDWYGGNRWLELLRTKLFRIPHVAWNAKYDDVVLRQHGITPGPLHGDGMLAAYLVGEHRAALKPYVLRTYGVRMIEYDDVMGSNKSLRDVPTETVAEYCSGDAFWALKAEADLRPRLNPKALALYEQTDLPMVNTIVDMELAGIVLDRNSTSDALTDTKTELTRLKTAITLLVGASGFNLSSTRKVCGGCRNGKNKKLTCTDCDGKGEFFYENPINPGPSHQLVQWLHGHLKIPIQAISQKTQQPSVSSLALLRMQHKHAAIPIILRWRTLERYRQFLEDWLAEADEQGRIHTSFTLAHTHSGRLSSRNPNLQQLALAWRKHFVASDGRVLVAADYHALEIRVAAFVSRDEGLMSIVNSDPETPAGDIHAQNVYKLFGIPYEDQQDHKALRTRAKNYMFGALYWSKGYEVVEVLEKLILADPSLGVPPTLKEIMRGIQDIRATYPHYFLEWGSYMIEHAREQGNTSYTAFGRPRVLPDLVSPVKSLREAAERATLNHIVQGSAADLARMACNGVTRLEGGTLLLQVHDELLSEVLESEVDSYVPKMVECMELGQPLEGVPLVVKPLVGRTWEETHG
jgi:DNA polymerase-1